MWSRPGSPMVLKAFRGFSEPRAWDGTGEKMGLPWALDGDWIGRLMGSGEIWWGLGLMRIYTYIIYIYIYCNCIYIYIVIVYVYIYIYDYIWIDGVHGQLTLEKHWSGKNRFRAGVPSKFNVGWLRFFIKQPVGESMLVLYHIWLWQILEMTPQCGSWVYHGEIISAIRIEMEASRAGLLFHRKQQLLKVFLDLNFTTRCGWELKICQGNEALQLAQILPL